MIAAPARLKIAAGVSLAVFGLLLITGPVFGQDGSGDETGVSLFQAILIGIGYYLSNSPWLMGNGGFFGFYRPLVAGFIVGIILGDPVKGAQIGAAINILYLGFISAGGSIPADPSVAGWVGTALAIGGGLDAASAIALGVAVGTLGTFIFFTRMSVDATFAHWADARAEDADIGGVARMNWLPPQIFLFIISFIPATIAVYLGAPVVENAISWLNTNAPWVLSGLQIAGGLLPAIGIAMNMRFIFRGTVWPYFFIGYIMAVASAGGLNIVMIGLVGVALAFIHVSLLGGGAGPTARQTTADRVQATRDVAATSEGV
ncbi:MAG TPA: PTS sugar transporter subunit IIC [Candidatus Limnocylindria bacterium]|nr:PTS sugar transporter subunit IIC [Candidatus Limnocylindria bacterium]